MTVEDLSHASADRYVDRMMHDVKSTSQIRFPPRPPPTFSARESLETPPADNVDDVISARLTNKTNDPPVSNTAKRTTVSAKAARTVQERFHDFYADFESLEPMLSTHLSPEDKKRFVRAIRGPSPIHRPETVTIAVSVFVLIMTAMVCFSHHPNPREPRSRAARASPPPVPAATSLTTNFNIERLLKPLNRSH